MRDVELTGISSVQHFLVDGLCICCMYLLAGAYSDSLGAILTYNVLAFMSQPLTGLIADRMVHRHWLLLSSALLLTIAVAMASLMPVADEWPLLSVAVLLGMGNSLFHVWGGKQTVVKMGNDIRALGVFVSTGVLGLAVGLVFCSWTLLYVLLLAIVLLSVAYVQLDDGSSKPVSASINRPAWLSPMKIWVAIVLLMFFVGYRSFAGELFSKGISKSQELILIIAAVAMLGKVAGGWIARWVGILRSLMVILAGGALCFLFRGDYVLVLLLGIFLMNLTMPITLFLANEVLPGREGLAFGLLAAVLVPGYLLAIYL